MAKTGYSLVVHPVYRVITWRSPLSYITAAGAFILVVLMHWLGRVVWQKCKRGRYEDSISRRG